MQGRGEEMTAYALSVANEVVDLEPSSYTEARGCENLGK